MLLKGHSCLELSTIHTPKLRKSTGPVPPNWQKQNEQVQGFDVLGSYKVWSVRLAIQSC